MTSIRAAVPDDAEVLARLNSIVQDLHRARRPDQFRSTAFDELMRWYRSRLVDPSTQAWIAENDSNPVGYALAMLQRRPATPFAPVRTWYEVDQIAVHPDHRRQGIGRSLMEVALAAASDLGVRNVEVSSWAFNEDMHHLLGNLGFAAKVLRFERGLPGEPSR